MYVFANIFSNNFSRFVSLNSPIFLRARLILITIFNNFKEMKNFRPIFYQFLKSFRMSGYIKNLKKVRFIWHWCSVGGKWT